MATQLKPPSQGLLDRTGPADAGFISGWAFDVYWKDLQPTPDKLVLDVIHEQLKQARMRGNKSLKIRLRCAQWTPPWVLDAAGRFKLLLKDSPTSPPQEVTVGKWWTRPYKDAYQHLLNLLAQQHHCDDEPLIRSVVASMCTALSYPETYLRHTGDSPENGQRLLDAGFSVPADLDAHIFQAMAHKRAFQHTRCSIAFNPYQAVQPDGTTRQDLCTTLEQLTHLRQLLGDQLIIENYSLRDQGTSHDPLSADYEALWHAMKNAGPPIGFQTAATKEKLGDPVTVMRLADSLGANHVELLVGYESMDGMDWAHWNTVFQHNPTGAWEEQQPSWV
ncbi:hypothetical protein HMI49_39580 [Corallococcus exercitus]|uniref:Uncharacterized protein n=1 Tax=Corallococcus exercitus TaxID=2316736 RepID=A0A7Y4KSU9_9BACT|nr:hypothetical protein [Corallococcus exercitus]NOK39295.1 hypothetical protein [Corallococcus exercitus]